MQVFGLCKEAREPTQAGEHVNSTQKAPATTVSLCRSILKVLISSQNLLSQT